MRRRQPGKYLVFAWDRYGKARAPMEGYIGSTDVLEAVPIKALVDRARQYTDNIIAYNSLHIVDADTFDEIPFDLLSQLEYQVF